MTKDEFRKWFDAHFWDWVTSSSKVDLGSFLYSLEEFAIREYYKFRKEEKDKEVGKNTQTG